ncbi:MAG: septum formation initiator family protein [Flavobacteriales bacterium]|nr:septum formation initiator family protein [Flavobacteriales bacterium]
MNRILVKYKYLIILTVFVLWISFFDEHNLVHQYKLGKEIKILNEEKEFYKADIEAFKIKKKQLESDLESLEAFAREEYLMKKPDEDLYLLDEK